MSTPLTTEHALWHQCFTENHQQLLQLLVRYVGNMEDARELAQELWLRLPPTNADTDNRRAYLFGMARNMAFDHLRRQGRERECVSDLYLEQDGGSAAPDQAKQHQQQRLLQEIQSALQGQPERVRDAFLRHQIDGESLHAIARRHGVSRPTIVRDIARAQACVDTVVDRWNASNAPADDTSNSPAGEDSPSKQQLRQQRRRLLLSSLMSVVGLGGSGALAWQLSRHLTPQQQYVLASHTAQRLAPHTLPDGSTLTLDAASRTAITYYAVRRTVQLQQGAAHFDIVRDAQRPFTVRAEGLQIRVLGTQFSVDIQPVAGAPRTASNTAPLSTRAAIEIAVTHGTVRVEPIEQTSDASAHWRFAPLELQAGQHIRVYATASEHDASVIEPLDTAEAGADETDWRHGRLNFHNAPLGRIIPRLQRYSQRQFRLDPRAAALPVTARIHTDEAEQWLRLLPRILPVRVTVQPGSVDIVAQ